MCLSPVQHSLIIGTLLGDGTMRCKENALLEVNHSLSQKSYVDWKHRILSDLVLTAPRERTGNGGRVAYRFTTRSLPQLTRYYHAFYRAGRKVIPPLALTPLALAVWFMDDGCKSYRAVYFNTQQFSVEEQHRLLRMLGEQWGIAGALNRDKQYFRIRLAVDSVSILRDAILPHLLPEMRYKLPA